MTLQNTSLAYQNSVTMMFDMICDPTMPECAEGKQDIINALNGQLP